MNFALEPTQNEYYAEGNFEVSDTAWELLEGAMDLHVHSNPTQGNGFVLDDFELVREYEDAGLKGVCIKCHEFGSFFRAQLAQKYATKTDTFKVYGSVTLNEQVGGINPVAAESAIKCGAKIVYFPTYCARHQHDIWTGDMCYPAYSEEILSGMCETYNPQGLSVFDEEGALLPQVYEVLEVIRDANVAVASGHLSNREGLALFEAARKMGIKKMIFQHIDWRTSEMSLPMQRLFAEMGVKLEKSFYEFDPDRSMKSFASTVGIAPENYLMSSDQGMFPALRALRGYACNVQEHLNGGVPAADLRIMLQDVPTFLMEG